MILHHILRGINTRTPFYFAAWPNPPMRRWTLPRRSATTWWKCLPKSSRGSSPLQPESGKPSGHLTFHHKFNTHFGHPCPCRGAGSYRTTFRWSLHSIHISYTFLIKFSFLYLLFSANCRNHFMLWLIHNYSNLNITVWTLNMYSKRVSWP